jgi:hypothetical protein
MPRYLTPEWVQAFNAALSGLDLSAAIAATAAGSLTASDGAFAVAQVVTDGPDGEVRTILAVDETGVTMTFDPDGARRADVTIVLRYEDALAVARGSLDPADALATGRVRVRGELAVLVAGQSVLNAAGVLLGTALADLTD